MKKIIIVVLIVLVVLAAALFAVPVIFKQKLLDATKTTINKRLNAEVQFTDFNLSLFQNFPKAF